MWYVKIENIYSEESETVYLDICGASIDHPSEGDGWEAEPEAIDHAVARIHSYVRMGVVQNHLYSIVELKGDRVVIQKYVNWQDIVIEMIETGKYKLVPIS